MKMSIVSCAFIMLIAPESSWSANSNSQHLKFEDLDKLISAKNEKVEAARLHVGAQEFRTGRLGRSFLPQISLVAGVAVAELLEQYYPGRIELKWPNDVLIDGRKAAGILAEAVWMGDQVESVVIGIGVNVLPESVPPSSEVHFPATSIHSEGLKIDRIELLHDLLSRVISLRPQLEKEGFIQALEKSLAFMNTSVQIWSEPAAGQNGSTSFTGTLRGLEADGALRLETASGIQIIQFGEIRLRPV